MKAVYWDAFNNEQTLDESSSEEEWKNWYKYVRGDNATDTKTSRWANAKITDENGIDSYFVWIPRYEYRIEPNTAKVEVRFIEKTQTEANDGYNIHPAFQDGTSNNFQNGEWDKELSGIWISKYEISHSDATIANMGSSSNLKVAPNVQSWRNITAINSYHTAYDYDRTKESHLIKNSEWGAVAYLAYSYYGRNANLMSVNDSSSCVTGSGGESASTTGNIYGVYDMVGGACECVSSYNSSMRKIYRRKKYEIRNSISS